MKTGSRRRNTLRIAIAAAVTLGLPATSIAAGGEKRQPKKDVTLQLLSFNDYHGWLEEPTGTDATLGPRLDPAGNTVGGGEYLATTLKTLRGNAKHSITATAGDLIGGTPFLSGLFHDEPSVESLEAMGLDVSGVGNHEFDEGLTELLRIQNGGCHPLDGCYFPEAPYDGASFPWLAANVVHADTGRTVLPPTWVKRVGGVKVGFIGMTLEDTPTLVAQAGIRGLDFQDEVEAANTAVKKLKKRGVRTIIVLLHEGGIQTGTYGQCTGISGPIVQIAENLHPEIDVVVTGHTHQPYICTINDPKGQPRMVTSASSFGRVVTESTIVINRRTGNVRREQVTSTNHLVLRTVAKDPTQTAILAKWRAKAAPIANRVVGTITADIVRSPGRNTESSLANLIADAQLSATEAPGDGGAQIALMNPGGVRADLTFAPSANIPTDQPGQVTYGEAFTVQPFGNLLVTMDLTGGQLEQVLEQQAVTARPGGRDILILGVSRGFSFSYCTTCANGARIDPASMTLNGAPISPTGTYRVTVNNFLADGGDSFTVLTQGTNRLGGGDDLAAFTAYLGANTPVVPAPTDRIVEVTAP
jgi:2',3'-cyclic-nucleotide 2'-phosphodiesterase (5'-nucleotidase family)